MTDEALVIAAPFAIAGLILIVGSAASHLGKQRLVRDLTSAVDHAKATRRRGEKGVRIPAALQPDNVGDYADWLSDLVTAASSFIGPVAGVTLALNRSNAGVTIANVAAMAATFMLFVYVATIKDVADWSAKSIGWFSRTIGLGVLINVLCGMVALLLA